jgi:hypothetical protein
MAQMRPSWNRRGRIAPRFGRNRGSNIDTRVRSSLTHPTGRDVETNRHLDPCPQSVMFAIRAE